MPHPVRLIRHARLVLPAILTCLLIVACGGNSPPPPATTSTAATQAATLRTGDVTIRASAVPTTALAAAVASQYGIERGDGSVLLLVAVRRGAEAQEVSVPAQVSVTATDLFGQRRDVPMRELRSGELLDYIGTLEVSAPDTLRFDLRIVPEDGQASTLQFTREFHPQ